MECCTKPDLYRAWVPRRPFGKAVYCWNCGETTMAGGIHGWFFEWFIAPFWAGQVEVSFEPVKHD